MKRTWVIPAMLVAGVAGLGGLTYAASAQNGDGCGQCYMRGEGDDGWSGQRWRNDNDARGGNDERGPRWRDRDEDSRAYGPRAGGEGNENCGPRGRGYHGRGHGMHHGYGYGRGRDDMDRGPDRDRGYDRREGRGYDNDRDYDRREGRGGGWREGRRFDRDDADRGYRGHGYYHRHHQRQEGRGGPGMGRGFDPARLESVKKEIGVTEAQEQAWTKYTATLKEVADARKTRRESMDHGAMRRMSTEEHRQFRDAMIQQRRKEQDSVNAAVDELIKSLDEKQVAIAKEVLPGYAFGPWMRGAGMGWGGGRNR